MQRKGTCQILSRLDHRIHGFGDARELRRTGVDVAHGGAYERCVMHRKYRFHLGAVVDGLIRRLAPDQKRGVVATKRLLTHGDVLDGFFQLLGLLRVTLHRTKVRNVLLKADLGLVAILKQKGLNQRELKLLLNGFIPHPRIGTTTWVITQIVGGRKTLTTSVRSILDEVVLIKAGDAVDHGVTQAGIADQDILIMAVDQQAKEATDLRVQSTMLVFFQCQERRIVAVEHGLGDG